MQTYYTIISAVIRPEINETLSLGLLVMSDTEIFLNFSKTKISVLNDLLPKHRNSAIKHEIRDIEIGYKEIKKDKALLLFKSPKEDMFYKDYLDYLSRYKYNGIVFSKPKEIDIQISKEIFEVLYHRYVDEDLFTKMIEDNIENSIEKYRKEVLPNLSKYYNTNRKVGSDIIADAMIPIHFDLVGKNEVEVFAKSIDLERRVYNIEHDISLLYPLKNFKNEAKKFFISKEPMKKYKKQHDIWNNLRKEKWLEYVDISEVEKLETYAKLHNVEPLFKENNIN